MRVRSAGELGEAVRTARFIAMNRGSREPQSRSMAAFTVADVVRGPGVRR